MKCLHGLKSGLGVVHLGIICRKLHSEVVTEIPGVLAEKGLHRPLLVADASIRGPGLTKRLEKVLAEEGGILSVYDRTQQNATTQMVLEKNAGWYPQFFRYPLLTRASKREGGRWRTLQNLFTLQQILFFSDLQRTLKTCHAI